MSGEDSDEIARNDRERKHGDQRGDESSGLSDDNDMDLLLENERADIEKLQREFL